MTDATPIVGVIMGSDSDLRVMQDAIDTLDEFGVPREVHIVSAHRTPDRMFEYARTAVSRGLRVIIAGAGGAAHLPGMTASLTPLPVIGVPVPLEELDGLDSLLSIVQMPNGVPVATVGIGKGRNAALLAVRILCTHDDALRARMEKFQAGLTETVLERDANFSDRSD
jgi:5-(carboxyamino)imidazole ribonucleotide mutase